MFLTLLNEPNSDLDTASSNVWTDCQLSEDTLRTKHGKV